MTRALEIEEALEGKTHALTLVGRLDANTSAQLDAVASRIWTDDNAASVVMDMSACTFVSSAGLRVLVAMQKRATVGGGSLRLHSVTPDVREILSVSGIDSILTID